MHKKMGVLMDKEKFNKLKETFGSDTDPVGMELGFDTLLPVVD